MENLPASSLLQELRASLPSSASQLPTPASSMPSSLAMFSKEASSPLAMFSSPLLDSSSLSLAAHQVSIIMCFGVYIGCCSKKVAAYEPI